VAPVKPVPPVGPLDPDAPVDPGLPRDPVAPVKPFGPGDNATFSTTFQCQAKSCASLSLTRLNHLGSHRMDYNDLSNNTLAFILLKPAKASGRLL